MVARVSLAIKAMGFIVKVSVGDFYSHPQTYTQHIRYCDMDGHIDRDDHRTWSIVTGIERNGYESPDFLLFIVS